MLSEQFETLIKAALTDGKISEKEKEILLKRAEQEGLAPEELEMLLEARAFEAQKNQETPAAPMQTPAAAPAPAPQQKSSKIGTVIKCPACGAFVNSYSGKCNDCGYVFENVKANEASVKLFDLLQKAVSDEDKENIVSSFPVPFSKTDLLELITALHSYIYDPTTGFRDENSGYHHKYNECIQKAIVSFSDDPQLKYYIDEFNLQKKNQGKTNAIILATAIGVLTLVGGIAFWIIQHFDLGYIIRDLLF